MFCDHKFLQCTKEIIYGKHLVLSSVLIFTIFDPLSAHLQNNKPQAHHDCDKLPNLKGSEFRTHFSKKFTFVLKIIAHD